MIASAFVALLATVSASRSEEKPKPLVAVDCLNVARGCSAEDYKGQWDVNPIDYQSACIDLTYTVTPVIQRLRFTEGCGSLYRYLWTSVEQKNGLFFSYVFNGGFKIGITKVWKRDGEVVAAFVKQSLVHDYFAQFPNPESRQTPKIYSTVWFKKFQVTPAEKDELIVKAKLELQQSKTLPFLRPIPK